MLHKCLFRAAAVETILQAVGGQGPQHTGRPPWGRAFSRSRRAGRSSDSRGTRLFVSERRGSELGFRFTSGGGLSFVFTLVGCVSFHPSHLQ